jgi:hypothetical protein
MWEKREKNGEDLYEWIFSLNEERNEVKKGKQEELEWKVKKY